MPHDMPAFRDQGDPEIVWVWDAEAHDYAPKRLNEQSYRGWQSGGDNELFDPAVHRMKPKDPMNVGILATYQEEERMSNDPGVPVSNLQNACGCDAENMPHEWHPQWGCPPDGPEPLVDAVDYRTPPPEHYSDGPFPGKVPRQNSEKRDPSFPSMSLSSAPVSNETMPQFDHYLDELAYRDKLAANLASCPDCATPLKESGGTMVCSGCGNKQPILTMSRQSAALGLGLMGRLMGGAMTPGAMPGAASMLGRGALFGAGEGMLPGVPGTPEEQDLPMLPVQSVAKTAGPFDESYEQMMGPVRQDLDRYDQSRDQARGKDAAQHYYDLRMQQVPPAEAMQQVAVEYFNGDVAAAQQAVGANVQLTGMAEPADAIRTDPHGWTGASVTGASDEEEEVGLATKNRGDDDNPEHKTQGFMEEHGDQPELLKDVELVGDASREGEDSGLDEDSGAREDAMKAFHANLPLVIEFATSDQAGQDHPVLKALDELLESVFPGYKGSDDGDNAETDSDDESEEHEKKEAASWAGPDPNAGLTAPGQPVGQPGVVGIQDTCPIDGAGPGVPCAHKTVTQGAAAPGAAAPGIPGVPGIPSQVPHPTMANVDEAFEKHAARRPKMCPFHRDLVDYSLELGDPSAALSAIQPAGYGETGWCKSGQYEGNCNFRAPMVKQEYWDAKDAEYAERAEQRRLEQEALQTRVEPPVVEPEPEIDYQVPDVPQDGVQQVAEPDDDGQGATLEGAPSAVGVGVPAFARVIPRSDLKRRTENASYDIRGSKLEAPRDRRRVSMFEMLSDEDLTGPLAEGPQHILADREGENLSDDAPETHSDAREKRDVPEHHHSPAEHPVSEENRSNATIHDSEGLPLQEGEDYLMKSPNYEIPDKVTIESIDGNQITYTVHTDLSEYTDQIDLETLRSDGLVFINDTTNAQVTDSSEEDWTAPPRPDAVGGPGEVTDLSRLPTPVSSVEKDAMALTKKHFQAIADILRNNGVDPNSQLYGDLVQFLQGQNELFDPQRFERAVAPQADPRGPAPLASVKEAGDVPEALKEHQFKKKDEAEVEQTEPSKPSANGGHAPDFEDDDPSVADGEDPNEKRAREHQAAIARMEAGDKPVSRREAMENPELVQQGTEYTPRGAWDQPDARDWLFEGREGGVEIDPHLAAKYAGKNFTPREQREFIDEKGAARNLDKLDLSDTHYIEDADLDPEFLFGARG